ncbi:hypothetical protein PAF17_19060 [Paracoccus sp. Z330]|uniref:Uncharacterized protein n=1 Tax=Paracoccus onchidii TaxID=3017813 RepID=A0ABT4ZJM6_9RHOB|nr:hypothetical protein [Paracoccus onchidii]MDB6179572.1 hypothetical protein [Paracoccus onchidii]
MTFDPATQAISRFVGLLELIVDGDRMRQEFLEFQRNPPPEPDGNAFPGISVKLLIEHSLPEYDPALFQRIPAPDAGNPGGQPDYFYIATYAPLPVGTASFPEPGDLATLPAADPGAVTTTVITPPVALPSPPGIPLVDGAPGSIVSVTLQVIAINDDDLVVDGSGSHFVNPEQLHLVLNQMEDLADALAGFDIPEMPEMSDWMPFAQAVLTQFDGVGGEALPETAQSHVLRADDAAGIVVDGRTADEASEWTDHLPAYLRPDDDVASNGADEPDAAAPEGHETVIRTSSGMDGKVETSHLAEHDFSRDFPGRNTDGSASDSGHHLIAGGNSAINEIGVASQWIDAPLIVVRGDVAKVHAVSQTNVLLEHDSVNGKAVTQPSNAMNVAEITQTPVPASGAAEGLPSSWSLFRLEATLYQVNWIKQVTYLTDYDRVEMTYSAQMTMLVTGENDAVNSTILNELGYRFDVIFVAGDMVDATIISQKNILHDSDLVTGAAVTSSPDGVSLADNLLFNSVTIETKGVDSFASMSDDLARAADDLAKGANTLAENLLDEAMTSARDTALALQIDGDLIRVNVFEQENIIGDADQLRLDMAQLQAELAQEASLIAGSNLLVNTATVTEYGIDSTIMAGGKVYDDAMIHQAEWFDSDAPVDGVRLAELTNDAVAAFLSEELPHGTEAVEAIAATSDYDTASNLDVMQGVLA